MALSETERQNASSEFQRDESREHETISGLKSQVRQLIDALDDYLDANQVAINQSIPQPARNLFTQRQKARALIYIVEKRYLNE